MAFCYMSHSVATGYAGARVVITDEIAKAKCRTQIDIGFGDVVTPGPVDAVYPVLIEDQPAPQLRTYPVNTVVSEKLHAIALLGMTNSRLKDYLDIWVLLVRETFDTNTLAKAIAATFSQRGMSVPTVLPIGLTDEFANDPSRQGIWRAFLRKNQLAVTPLLEVVTTIRTGLQPALIQAAMLAPTEGAADGKSWAYFRDVKQRIAPRYASYAALLRSGITFAPCFSLSK